jgi:uncharacterized HAD superfamily protein
MATHDDSPSIGIDLDGTIDEAPEFFRILTNLWPGRIYIITYRDDYARAVADVRRHGVKYDQIVLVDSFREKAARIAELGISVYFDDMDEMLMHIPEGVAVMKIRNGGNFDYTLGKWLYSKQTGREL